MVRGWDVCCPVINSPHIFAARVIVLCLCVCVCVTVSGYNTPGVSSEMSAEISTSTKCKRYSPVF